MLNLDLHSGTPETPRFARFTSLLALLAPLALVVPAGCSDDPEPPPPRVPGGPTLNGLDLPNGFLDWSFIGVANRIPADGSPGTIRIIVGNDTAVQAARNGNTNPWPDGTILADVVYGKGTNPYFGDMVAPTEFTALATMHKNAAAYADDGGWKYGLWAGADLTPSEDELFDRDCVDCHLTMAAADNDYVFMRLDPDNPVPALDVIGGPTPDGVEFPTGWQDWAMIGVTDRIQDGDVNAGSIRVIVGNSVAVEAARTGNTNPWPDGSEIADVVYTDSGPNPNWAEMNGSSGFAAMAYMKKDSVAYANTYGWGYGIWRGQDLAVDTDPATYADCVDCHNTMAAENDQVFTQVLQLPTLPASP